MNNLLDPFFPNTLPGVMQITDPVPAIAFVLSSGRTFGLTIVRARNRLLKVSNLLKVNIERPETKSLVELIEIYPKKDPRVQYFFCGHSLETTDQFYADLPESDSEELQGLISTENLTALFTELETYREIARESTFLILAVPMKWRSRLSEWAESFNEKCPEDQFRNRMLKQPGLRKEECRWHDLVRWVFYERPPGPIDPSQLHSEFRLRHVIPRLYRLVGSGSPDPGVLWRCDRGLRRGERRNLPKIGEDSRVVLQHPSLGFSVVKFAKNDLLGSSCGWIAIDNKGKPLKPGDDIADDTIQTAAGRVLASINRVVNSWALYSDNAQWAEYTLADSDERQEHLLVLDDFPHRFENNPHYDVDNTVADVPLTPANYVAYRMVIRQNQLNKDLVRLPSAQIPDTDLAWSYMEDAFAIIGLPFDENATLTQLIDLLADRNELHPSGIANRTLDSLRIGMRRSFFSERMNEIRSSLHEYLPEKMQDLLEIRALFLNGRKATRADLDRDGTHTIKGGAYCTMLPTEQFHIRTST